MVEKADPPTQREMAKVLDVSQRTIGRNIKKLNMKLVKKPKGHALTPATILKRYKRSWPLYLRLRKDRWKRFIRSDEAWFYITNSGGKRNVQYISRFGKRSDAEVQVHVAHPKGIMVWLAISANDVTKPFFVEPGAKINWKYYINKVLRPFLKEAKRLYPDNDFVFHQDSAPSHTGKTTLEFLKSNKIVFLTPLQWIPSSPDAAPCDYFLWGYLKPRLNKRKITTTKGLKKAIREVKKIPQEMINRALKAWPKRCRQIYYNKGLHIEKFR
jgi:hypothetical protein